MHWYVLKDSPCLFEWKRSEIKRNQASVNDEKQVAQPDREREGVSRLARVHAFGSGVLRHQGHAMNDFSGVFLDHVKGSNKSITTTGRLMFFVQMFR